MYPMAKMRPRPLCPFGTSINSAFFYSAVLSLEIRLFIRCAANKTDGAHGFALRVHCLLCPAVGSKLTTVRGFVQLYSGTPGADFCWKYARRRKLLLLLFSAALLYELFTDFLFGFSY